MAAHNARSPWPSSPQPALNLPSFRLQRRCGAGEDVDRLVDMRQVGPKRQYGAAQPGGSIDAGAAEENPALLLDPAQQPVVEGVGIAAVRQTAERDDRKIRRWPGIPSRQGRQPRM